MLPPNPPHFLSPSRGIELWASSLAGAPCMDTLDSSYAQNSWFYPGLTNSSQSSARDLVLAASTQNLSLLSLEAPFCHYCGHMWNQYPSFPPASFLCSSEPYPNMASCVKELPSVALFYFLKQLVELGIAEVFHLSLQKLNLTQLNCTSIFHPKTCIGLYNAQMELRHLLNYVWMNIDRPTS